MERQRQPKWRRITEAVAVEDEPIRTIRSIRDDLLRMILLRLDSPLWLLRASCAAAPRNNSADDDAGDRTFLRLARSLHPTTVAGHYYDRGTRPNLFVPSMLRNTSRAGLISLSS
ncbi:unnamed protein product [Urochloa humidicola]